MGIKSIMKKLNRNYKSIGEIFTEKMSSKKEKLKN